MKILIEKIQDSVKIGQSKNFTIQMLLLASMNPTIRLKSFLDSGLMIPKNLDMYKDRIGGNLPDKYYLDKHLNSLKNDYDKVNISYYQQLFKTRFEIFKWPSLVTGILFRV